MDGVPLHTRCGSLGFWNPDTPALKIRARTALGSYFTARVRANHGQHQQILYRVTSLIRKRTPPWDPPRTLGIGLQ